MRNPRRLASIWAVRLGPGHLMALSTAVLALVAGVTGGRVTGEARWLTSWDAGVLAYLALSWAIVVLLDPTRTRRRVLRKTPTGLALFWVVLIAACASAAAGVMMIHQPLYDSASSPRLACRAGAGDRGLRVDGVAYRLWLSLRRPLLPQRA